MKIAIIFERYGPYHAARVRELSDVAESVIAIELFGTDNTYAWATVAWEKLKRTTLLGAEDDLVRWRGLYNKLDRALAVDDIQVIAVPGWSALGALVAVRWACDNRIPIVMMSDSRAVDAKRVLWKEWIKRRVLRLCSAFFVSGAESREYLTELGVEERKICLGYDVVDNAYFASESRRVRRYDQSDELGVGIRPFFLASGRFVAKKNFQCLIRAFSIYREAHGSDAWNLVILGDGPCRKQLVAEAAKSGVSATVALPGFMQYGELPWYYAHAGAFVLPSIWDQWGLVVNEAMAAGLPVLVSKGCGCARDLVVEGENGFLFDPSSPQELAELMSKVSCNYALVTRMGRASQEIINHWGLKEFAENLLRAAEAAYEVGCVRDYIGRGVLQCLLQLRTMGGALRVLGKPTGESSATGDL